MWPSPFKERKPSTEQEYTLETLNLAKRGNREALDRLFEGAYDDIYAYCRHMCGDAHFAEDLTQEALARAMANLDRFRGDSRFSTWAIRIAIHVYRDVCKKKRPELKEDWQPSLEDLVIERTFKRDLSQVLAELPEQQRQVFVLKHLMGYDYQHISELASCPLGTVRSRLHASLQKIKQGLGERGWP